VGGSVVVKIANLAEPHEQTRFQNRALRHIAARDPALPVPRVIAARDGRDDVVLPSGHLMRVISWLAGVPLHLTPRSAAQRRALARGLARLDRALEGFDDAAADHPLLWDIKNAGRLRPLLPLVPDPALRDICEAVLDRFDVLEPQLRGLRWQIVHSDLNPHNVLVAAEDPERLAGIIDFGDMVKTPLVCDVAVACAYQIDRDAPLASLLDFAAAYHADHPLTDQERALLFDLTAARMVTTVAITGWRAAKYPENRVYILRNFPSARAGLMALASVPREDALAALTGK
jgi:Ser/Thr protein kinase RdoA (MazF antagonist)